MKKVKLFYVYLASFIYLELAFKLLVGNQIFKLSTILMCMLLIIFSLIMSVISTLFKSTKKNKIIFLIIMLLNIIIFNAEYVVKGFFNFYISLSGISLIDQIGSFAYTAVLEIIKRLPGIIILFIPLILSIIFNKYIDFDNIKWPKNLGYILGSVIVYILFILCLNIDKDKMTSPYTLYHDINNVTLNFENFGVINTMIIDIKRNIFGFNERIVVDDTLNDTKDKEEEEEIVYKYNNLDIDFANLINNESNKTIKQIHEYMGEDSGTLQNEYTGFFKDKNLILFMAESFNEIAVREDLTPTLYKLVNSGFSFKNFYTPTIYSTIGGEFQELTGLYASSTGILSKFRSGNIAFPQGLATKFKENNYDTFAYHDNTYTFQDRNKYLKSLGFDNFKACGNGLEDLINCKEWPQSDVSMIDVTFNDYINSDKFMVFYASVSGHSGYTWSSNAQARKHKEEYLQYNLNYSEKSAAYLAAQMELDKALELLINKLEESGKLDDTVIALVGDHNPYVLSLSEINEISSFEREEVITRNKSNFILWNNGMDTVEVSKVGSQIDVMPTIYNVFGINYDSRLFIGKDILSTEGGLAIFGDNSWVSDKGKYYSSKGKFIPNDGVEYDEEYVKSINRIVNNKVNLSKLIIENNYYSYIK